MSNEPADSSLSQAELTALQTRFTAQQVVSLFAALGLPVSDDSAAIQQITQRDSARKQKENTSSIAVVQQVAAAWLEAAHLLGAQASRRELLLIVQSDFNRMFSLRLERQRRDSPLYSDESRAQLKDAAKRAYNLHPDLAERFLLTFESASKLHLGDKIPLQLRPFDVRPLAEETFSRALPGPAEPPVGLNGAAPTPSDALPVEATSLQLPPAAPLPEALAISASALAGPVAPVPSAPAAPVAPVSPPKRVGPLLTPANATGRLLIVSMGNASEYLLEQAEVNIGRMPEHDICLKDDLRVSRHHAVIHRAPTAFILTDIGSGNGTTVNGTKIATPTILQSGDQLKMGQTTITFLLEPNAEPPAQNPDPA